MITKFRLNHHLQIKESVLEYIKKSDSVPILEKQDKISLSDYNDGSKKEYVKDIIKSGIFDEISNSLFTNEIKINHAWFQQYYENDRHNFHIHDSMMSLVYFVELNDSKYATEFFDVKERKIIKSNAIEGDVLIFNSTVPHRSPVILDKTRKTIISMNFEIKGLDSRINDFI